MNLHVWTWGSIVFLKTWVPGPGSMLQGPRGPVPDPWSPVPGPGGSLVPGGTRRPRTRLRISGSHAVSVLAPAGRAHGQSMPRTLHGEPPADHLAWGRTGPPRGRPRISCEPGRPLAGTDQGHTPAMARGGLSRRPLLPRQTLKATTASAHPGPESPGFAVTKKSMKRSFRVPRKHVYAPAALSPRP